MLRRVLMGGVMVIATLSVTSAANAGWRHWGWYGGYGWPTVGWTGYDYSYYAGGGGYGCCDSGWYGPAYAPAYTSCYTPCYRGCGLLGRIGYRWRAHHYGYYWGCGSPCWSVASCCSMCGEVGCDCGTSDVLYGEPAIVPEGTQGSPTPAEGQGAPTQEKQTLRDTDSALLTVSVPSGARVLVNGVATRSTGELRRYVSRNLDPGFSYTYEVTTEATVNGAPVTQTKTVQLRAGDQASLAFDVPTREAVETALTLHVPSDAQVSLAGNETRGQGPVRTFRTSKLRQGGKWSEYVVRVSVVRGGQNLTKEETITLRAGDQTQLTFDFDVDKVAAAR